MPKRCVCCLTAFFTCFFCVVFGQINQDLIPFRQNNGWGYSDSERNIVIPCQFEEAQFFTQDVAKVKNKGKWGLITAEGELFLPCQYDWLYCGSQKGRLIVCKGGQKGGHGGKWGFAPFFDGKEIPLQYDLIRETGIIGKLGVSVANLWGAIDAKGKLIIPIQYQVERISDHQFEKEKDNHSSVSLPNRIEEEMENEYLKLKFQAGIARVKFQNQWGYINEYGNVIIPFLYDFLGDFKGDWVVAVQKINNQYKMGFLDRKGEIKIPFEYDVEQDSYKQTFFSEGLAAVAQNSKKGYINSQNQVIIPFQFTQVLPFQERRALVSYTVQQIHPQWLVINHKGKQVCKIPAEYTVLDTQFQEGFIRIRAQENEFWMDKNGHFLGKNLYQSVEKFQNGWAKVYQKQGNLLKVGIINQKGEEMIPLQYEELLSFQYQDKIYFKAKLNGKWGIIQKNHQILLPFEYEELQVFAPDLKQKNWIIAQKNGKWGFIDRQGKVIIPFEYEKVLPFVGKYALVLYQGKWGYINEVNMRFWKD